MKGAAILGGVLAAVLLVVTPIGYEVRSWLFELFLALAALVLRGLA